MKMLPRAIALACLLLALMAPSCPNPIVQMRVVADGYVEPHTPGSGDPVEFPTSPTLDAIVGADADLNKTLSVRTRNIFQPPRAVLILMPGFLGGASTFDPVARDLVAASRGQIEVWAIDRRSNQVEDRRGARTTRAGVEAGEEAGDPVAIQTALDEGTRFYFSPVDLDGDAAPDPPFELPDESGGTSSFLALTQDELRFAAYWGVDTMVRDWKELVEEARHRVGPHGCVIIGGHSLGTTWTGLFAAYDFAPDPGVVVAGHELVDGLLLLEGGGVGAGDPAAPDLAGYLATVADLASPGGADVFLSVLFGFINPVDLGAAGEINGLAGRSLPDAPSILQKTNLFGGFPISILLGSPLTNEALPGFFLDDDFSTSSAFSASFGFSDNGPNRINPFPAFIPGDFLVADTTLAQPLRTWKNFDSASLPSCPPNDPAPAPGSGDVGCAIRDNGPKPLPGDPPATWGMEREVTDIQTFLRTLYETGNASEWYFVSGRPGLDFQYGRDSSALGAPELLNVTQNATVDVPVLAIGGSNGLTPTEDAFADYLGSIATPVVDQEIAIIEGYSHLDVVSAADNEAVPVIVDWVDRLLAAKRPPHHHHGGGGDDDDDDDDDD